MRVDTGSLQAPAERRRGWRPGSLPWLFAHELRLTFRDYVRTGRLGLTAVVALAMLAGLHLLGYWLAIAMPVHIVSESNVIVLFFTSLILGGVGMMALAQALEAITRGIYVRGDLELILSSPVSSRRVFVVRMVAGTVSGLTQIGFLLIPLITMFAVVNGWRWLSLDVALLALVILAQAMALAISVALFHVIGPRRTRLVAQIVAGVIGAMGAIGGQIPAVLKFGSLSRFAYFLDPATLLALPGSDSPVWWPAYAALGRPGPLIALVAVAVGTMAIATAVFSRGFAERVVAAAGQTEARAAPRRDRGFLLRNSPATALRRKEIRLILRDPWLASQSLMQLLYLVPPGLMLMVNFGQSGGVFAVIVPVVVMAAAQLAGGLAWLAISAEDAPDLIATAPVSAALAIRAKIEAVLIAVATVMAPFVTVLAIAAPGVATVSIVFALAAVASSVLIQLAFRGQSRRSLFRRRQASSRAATLAETFAGLAWAGSAALAAAGNSFWVIVAGVAVLVILPCGWVTLRRAGPARR